MLKIWHISDTHTYHNLLVVPDGIDMVIFSGDCSNLRDPYTNEHEVLNFLEWFEGLDIPHKVMIAGNHDSSIEAGLVTKETIHASGIYYLENTTVTIEGVKIFGSPYTPTFGQWSFMRTRGQLERMWCNVIDDDCDIVVVHGPPKGILDLASNRQNVIEFCGCQSLLNQVTKVQPKLMLFGHIHNCRGVVNAGTRTIPGLDTLFSNGSVVTDGKFGTLSSNGNILEIESVRGPHDYYAYI